MNENQLDNQYEWWRNGPGIVGTVAYWSNTLAGTSVSCSLGRLLPPAPTKGYGAWRCSYCTMINDSKVLSCDHCGAPGEL